MAAKKKEPLDQILQIPLTKSMKSEVIEEAENEERKPADMGRVLLREALDARKAEQVAAK